MRRLTDFEIPYDDTRDPAWEAGVDRIPWRRRHDDTCSKTGPCPRCGHSISFVEEAPAGGESRGADGQGKFEECNCGVIHPDTPEGRIGCGANGLISRAGSSLSADSEGTST
jgi:hypothetical protein